MNNFIKEFWCEFDVNLRKGYATFFLLALVLMPFTKYLSELYKACNIIACSTQDYIFFKNLIVLFATFSFIMIIVILGYVMKFFMVGYTKEEIIEEKPLVSMREKPEENKSIKDYEKRINRVW